MTVRDPLVHDDQANALVGWALTGVVLVAAVESYLSGAVLWSWVALAVAVVIAIPAFVTRDPTTIVPWPLSFAAATAVTAEYLGYAGEVAVYVTIAAFALIVVVELDVFTEVDMSRRFAVVFAVLATMAAQALWTIAQFYSDRWLGTEFLQTQTELQWDLVAVTVVALVMGLFFEWYLQKIGYDGSRDRMPGEAESA